MEEGSGECVVCESVGPGTDKRKGGSRFSYSISSGTGEEGYVEDEDEAGHRLSVGEVQTVVDGVVILVEAA